MAPSNKLSYSIKVELNEGQYMFIKQRANTYMNSMSSVVREAIVDMIRREGRLVSSPLAPAAPIPTQIPEQDYSELEKAVKKMQADELERGHAQLEEDMHKALGGFEAPKPE